MTTTTQEGEGVAGGVSPTPNKGLLLVHNCPQPNQTNPRQALPAPKFGYPTLSETDAIGFRPAQAMTVAASMFTPPDPGSDPRNRNHGHELTQLGDKRWLDHRTGEIVDTGPKAVTLSISGGLVQVQVNDVRNTPDDLDPDEPDNQPNNPNEPDGQKSPATRHVVDGFSRRSRNRCRAAAASLDWAGAQHPGEYLLMVTCTYPRDWRTCAPAPDHVTRHRRILERRYKRAVGHPLAAMWKREFQQRGAPHLHIFGWWPWTIGGRMLQYWLSETWYEIVDSGDPRHLEAGTGVDHHQSIDMTDPARVGNYFASYASTKGDKEYQNHAPADWTNPNGSVGRYWGIVGLERLKASVPITEDQMIDVQRLIRGVLHAQKRTVRNRYSRKGTRPDGQRQRHVNRRYRLSTLKGTERGFTFLTNDGAALAYDIARAINLPQADPWPKGQTRPLP